MIAKQWGEQEFTHTDNTDHTEIHGLRKSAKIRK